jgi:site-specific DNA recombinase
VRQNKYTDLYLRLSLDRDGKTAIERQELDCRAWAGINGLKVRNVHIDRGRSGYKSGVERRGLDAALAAVTSGVVGTLIVWKLDRLSRQGIGQVGLVLEKIEIGGGRLVSVMDGLDTSDEQARVIVAKLSELARSESENLGLRVRSAKMYLRSQGRWIGGRPPYGYVNRGGRRYVDPLTGPIVRECARRILDGSSIMKTVEWLNGEAIPAPRGGKWQVGSLAQLLRSPAVAGLLPETMKTQDGRYTGVVKPWRDPATGDTVSILGEAEEPLITPAEQARILERGKERAAATNWGLVGGRRSPDSQHLLTGLLRCAECDFRTSKQGNSYRCQSVRLGQPCLHPGGGYQAAVDDAVTRTWMARLTTAPPDDPLLIAVKERWLVQREPEAVAEPQPSWLLWTGSELQSLHWMMIDTSIGLLTEIAISISRRRLLCASSVLNSSLLGISYQKRTSRAFLTRCSYMSSGAPPT